MRIDSHHHIWDLSVRPQSWMKGDEVKPISRTILMDELEPELEKSNIDYTVIVQTVENPAETPEFLDLSLSHPKICAVVGWLDLESDDVILQLEKYLAHPGGKNLVSIRDMAQDKADPNWLMRDDVVKNIHRIADAGLTFDILTRPPQLAAAVEMVKRSPKNTFVLDHISKPYISRQEFEPWKSMITELSKFANVSCKISGLVTEAKWKQWKVEDYVPYIDHVIESFTPARLMFGSDWPVALLGADNYSQVVKLASMLTQEFSDSEKDGFWSENVLKYYKITNM